MRKTVFSFLLLINLSTFGAAVTAEIVDVAGQVLETLKEITVPHSVYGVKNTCAEKEKEAFSKSPAAIRELFNKRCAAPDPVVVQQIADEIECVLPDLSRIIARYALPYGLRAGDVVACEPVRMPPLAHTNADLNNCLIRNLGGLTGTFFQLNLDSNLIEALGFLVFHRCQFESVWLRNNRIVTIAPAAFCTQQKCYYINLNNNYLERLSTRMFVGLTALRYLNLSFNNISHIDNDALEPLCSLENLNLTGNKLTKFPNKALSRLKNPCDVQLKDNPLMEDATELNKYDDYQYAYMKYSDKKKREAALARQAHKIAREHLNWTECLKNEDLNEIGAFNVSCALHTTRSYKPGALHKKANAKASARYA